MSHDQKPGRVRVVGNAAPAPQRRRGDGSAEAPPAPAAAGAPVVAPAAGRPMLLLSVLFIAGCAIGGAALPLLGIL